MNIVISFHSDKMQLTGKDQIFTKLKAIGLGKEIIHLEVGAITEHSSVELKTDHGLTFHLEGNREEVVNLFNELRFSHVNYKLVYNKLALLR